MRARSLYLFYRISALLVFLQCIANAALFSQPSAALHGHVINQATGAPIAHAQVVLMNTKLGASTDTSGYYRIAALPPGRYAVQAACIGFENARRENLTLSAGQTLVLDFALAPQAVQMQAVEVEGERLWDKYQTDVSLIGTQRMRPSEITSVPGAFDDPTRGILLRSGATGAGDFNSFLTVRGSSPEQNLVVMDGAVIPNPYRFRLAMGGGLSIFDSKITRDVRLHLGGYTAEYGNALASVMEVETREGDLQRFQFRGGLNLTDAGGVLEGPLSKGKISFLLSGRRTYFDLLAERLDKKRNAVYPYFYDLTNKWLFHLNQKNKIKLALSASREATELPSVFADAVTLSESAATRHAMLSWKSWRSERVLLETLLSYYRDETAFRAFAPADTNLANADSAIATDYENLSSRIRRFSFQQKLRWKLREHNWLNAGLSAALVDSKIDFRSLERNFYFARNDIPRDIRFDEEQRFYAAYAEHTSEFNEKFQMRLGLRYDLATLVNQSELSHRLSAWYKLDERTTLEAAWGEVYQYPDPLTLSIRDQPLEIGANLKLLTAEKATQKVVGLKRRLNETMKASLEFYHLDIDRLLVSEDRETFEPFNQGRGRLQGVELVLEKEAPSASRLSGLLSYSLGSALYHNLKSKAWLPFNYDRRQALTLWLNQRVRRHWQISLLWRYASGLPYTEVLGVQLLRNAKGQVYWNFIRGPRNEKRLPAYQRLDARVSYVTHGAARSFAFYLDLINLFDHKNVYNLTWEKVLDPSSPFATEAVKRRTIYMLPFLPSLGLQFEL